MDEMLNYVDKDGIVQVGPRFNSNSFVPDAYQPITPLASSDVF